MKKRILINDYAGHPFQLDLSIKLSEFGYEVFHLYSSSSGGPKARFTIQKENLEIRNINIGKVEKLSFVKRFFQEYQFGKKLVEEVKNIQPDVIISANTPIAAQYLISKWAKRNQVKFIFWLQDIISIAAISLLSQKIPVVGNLIGQFLKVFEKGNLRRSDAIVCICDDFKEILQGWNIKENVYIIPNWAPIDKIPSLPKENSWSKQYNLKDQFVVLYSGTMGMKHNPEIITAAASRLKDHHDIQFVVVSEGEGADFIAKEATEKNLHIRVLPFQDFDQLPKVLASADVLLTVLEKDAGVFSVPSKVWSYYCAARASFLCVPKNNLSARITLANKAGIVIENDQSFSEQILYYKNNVQELHLMGSNARSYAEKNFNINDITNSFVKIIISKN
jgi:glycosyltransferase involved in cell wall biosynthesis